MGKSEEKKPLGRPRLRWYDNNNNKMDLQEMFVTGKIILRWIFGKCLGEGHGLDLAGSG